MAFRTSKILSVLIATGLATAACANDQPTATDRVSVVASFYPLAWVAEQVGGETVRVTNLTGAGAEPHDLELTPREVGTVSSADLVVFEHGFQPAVDAAVEQSPPAHTLDVSRFVDLEVAATANGGQSSTKDPHFWLDPTQLAEVADRVSDELVALEPDQAATIQQRTTTLIDQLTALDNEYRSGLARCGRRVFVTSHAAFGHLAERYDLEMVGISGLDPEAEPSPARIAEVQKVVQDRGVTTIFYETLVSPKVAEVIAEDLQLQTGVLDPIEGLTEATKNEDYLSLMRANLQAIQKANDCT